MKNDLHAAQDRQSLMLHTEAVRLLRADPELAKRALATLERWDASASTRSRPLRERWCRIISEQDWALALEQSEQGNQLRQASPLATLLPPAVRKGILQAARQERVLAHA